LSSSKGGPFAVVNGALAADALCVAAPANTTLAAPIHLICINTSAPAAAAATTSGSGSDADAQRCCSAPRLLVALAEGSEVEVVEEVVSVGTSSNHTSFAVTEVHLAEGASLKYGYVQREAAGAQQFKSTLVSQVGDVVPGCENSAWRYVYVLPVAQHGPACV
jgi:Fe-S cluster assembly protein SufD